MAATGQLGFPAVYFRGGTSKGLFFREGVLPEDAGERDRVLLRALGGGDPYGSEIDGVGGATSSTSKAVIVSPSGRPDFDVDYLFAQVSVTSPVVDWTGSCGNLAAAVAPFAIDEGLVGATGELTTVRIWQQNTSKEIVAHVLTERGEVVTAGHFRLDGVGYAAPPIRLDFIEPGGSLTGRLLPTGNVTDEIDADGILATVTMIDVGNPCVFVAAREIGLRGVELPSELNSDPVILQRLETIRAYAAVAMGLARTPAEATRDLPANPKVAVVSEPSRHAVSGGRTIEASEVDLVVRMQSMGKTHHALPATGATAAAVAALVPGSVPSRSAGSLERAGLVRIGHSSGVISLEAEVEHTGSSWNARRVTTWRSARRLMEGAVLVPRRDPPDG